MNTAAKMVLHDWQRGKIPFFTLPEGCLDEKPETRRKKDSSEAGG